MGTYNTVTLEMTCPRCGTPSEMRVDTYFGDTSHMLEMKLGDEYPFRPRRQPQNGGPLSPDQPWGYGYTQCSSCGKDFHCKCRVAEGRLVEVESDMEQLPHVPDYARAGADCADCGGKTSERLFYAYERALVSCEAGHDIERLLRGHGADTAPYGYQDEHFEVIEAKGEVVASLIVFYDDDLPEKLLGRFESGGRFHAYLGAWLGHWGSLDDEGYEWIFEDYEGCTQVELADEYDLRGQTIERVTCRRDEAGTAIDIQLATGTLRLAEVDPGDVHSDSKLEFISRKLASEPPQDASR